MLMNLKVSFGNDREPEYPMMEATEFTSIEEFEAFNIEQCEICLDLHNSDSYLATVRDAMKNHTYTVDADPDDSNVLLFTVRAK